VKQGYSISVVDHVIINPHIGGSREYFVVENGAVSPVSYSERVVLLTTQKQRQDGWALLSHSFMCVSSFMLKVIGVPHLAYAPHVGSPALKVCVSAVFIIRM
jgi:hypothetical protein